MKLFKWTLPKAYDSSVNPEHPKDEPEIEASDRFAKSATPKYTLDWYVKWAASIVMICAMAVRSSGIEELHIYDMWGSSTGAAMWWWVSFIWRDRALMLINGAAIFILTGGLLNYYFA